MAKQTITYHRRTRVKKNSNGGKSGYVRCNMCGGTGWHKAPKKNK